MLAGCQYLLIFNCRTSSCKPTGLL